MINRDDIILRSFMFVPANSRKYIEKAYLGEADAIILDVEDSVSPEQKQEARNIIVEYSKTGLFSKKKTYVRVNQIGSSEFVEDIMSLVIGGISGIMPSKIGTKDDIVFMDKLLSFFEIKNGIELGKTMIAPLIETTQAISNINEISTASKRLVALCFGGEDYLNDLGSVYTYEKSALIMPRALVVNASRAAGLLPIDTPYLNINDMESFEEDCLQAYKNGFAGRLLLNPKQIEIANKSFSPNDEMVSHSKRVVDAIITAERNGEKSVMMLDDKMIGPPMRKRAETVIHQKEKIDSYNI